VVSVTSALSGTELVVDFPPYDGKDEVSIAVGPAFLGTAVRDALSFIKFAQFTNQVDYADVGIALNDKVRSDVVASRTFTSARGHTVTFLGATEGEDPKGIVVTPVQLSLGS
jgi:predicted lipoprotein